MRGETRRKARRCIRRRSIAARIAAKTTGAAAHGAGERPSPRAPRRTRPEVPCAATVRVGSGTDRSRVRRVAQDSTPTAYMYTPSGSKDAQIARPAQGVPLPEPWPHDVRQTHRVAQDCQRALSRNMPHRFRAKALTSLPRLLSCRRRGDRSLGGRRKARDSRTRPRATTRGSP